MSIIGKISDAWSARRDPQARQNRKVAKANKRAEVAKARAEAEGRSGAQGGAP